MNWHGRNIQPIDFCKREFRADEIRGDAGSAAYIEHFGSWADAAGDGRVDDFIVHDGEEVASLFF